MIYSRTLIMCAVLLLAACDGEDRQAGSANPSATESRNALVIASNYPLYYFASRITAGVNAAPDIVFPDIDGDPALWIPSAEQVQILQSADVVILNGAGAERWPDLISIDQRRLFDTSVIIADRLIPLEGAVAHQHGPEGEHSHQGTAFTTWLDPQLALAQAQAVTSELIKLAPNSEKPFLDNLVNLQQELMALDSRLAEVFNSFDGQPVLFSHPVYQYLQRRYGINGESVHWEPHEEPTTSNWIALRKILATHPATIMIWEDQPLPSTAERLSDAGIAIVPFRAAANRPDEGDYFSIMRDNVARLAKLSEAH
jgi:zinc transport system substrate-binding protein